ncbi:MAG: hypothetical protein JW749_09470 [Sedimentisphaerales bacterium]|nr:hypothetical protein [Sedimentisphaerales bacterium]
MAIRNYWDFSNPRDLTLKNVKGFGGRVSKSEIHFTCDDADFNLTLHRPRLNSNTHSSLIELSEDLTEVKQLVSRREKRKDGAHQYWTEIVRKDGVRESIKCDKIEGLP